MDADLGGTVVVSPEPGAFENRESHAFPLHLNENATRDEFPAVWTHGMELGEGVDVKQ